MTVVKRAVSKLSIAIGSTLRVEPLNLWRTFPGWIASPTATMLPQVRNDDPPVIASGPRHCERSEAIQCEGLLRPDCFAATRLAKTPHSHHYSPLSLCVTRHLAFSPIFRYSIPMTLMLPKVDFAFKLLFGDERSKNILVDFLKAVLPELAEEEFKELTIV
ncbi:MAG: Rpn family recombination-promoting nuclease/putative transposase, partial [Spirochaetaceae bacterium]|nr:Rpn family recombination-promoting nuclease/putative transposase [Spirochaetaceae bacterium]